MMMTVARGAWVKWASSTPHAGIAARVPTATVSPSRTSRAMTHAISSSWVYRATSAVDVAVKVALERRVVDRGGDVLADRVGVHGRDAADERRPSAAGSPDERRAVDPPQDDAVAAAELLRRDDALRRRDDRPRRLGEERVVVHVVEKERAVCRRRDRVDQRHVGSDRRHEHDPLGGRPRVRDDPELRSQPLVVGAHVAPHRHERDPLGSRLEPRQEPGSGVVETPEPAALRVAAEVRRRPELVQNDLGELHRGDGPGADHQVDAETARRGCHHVEVARAAPEDRADHRDRRDHDRPAADPDRHPAPHVTRNVAQRDALVRHGAAIVGPPRGPNQVGSEGGVPRRGLLDLARVAHGQVTTREASSTLSGRRVSRSPAHRPPVQNPVAGPNGAGKTTLLSILATLLTPDSGTVRVLGHDVVRDAARLRRRLNMASGRPSFLWSLRVGEIVAFYGRLYGLSGQKLRRRVDELIELCELGANRRTPYSELSTGLKQRVALAKSLVNDPELLFLDEPTLGLDPDVSVRVRRHIADLRSQRGMTIVLTTHYMREADELCDEIAFIKEGRILARGTPGELKRRIRLGDVIALKLDPHAVPWLAEAPGVLRCAAVDGWVECTVDVAEKRLPDLLRALHAKGVVVRNVQVREPELEEVFVELAR